MAQATGTVEQVLQIDQVYLLGSRSEERLKETGARCVSEQLVTQRYYDTADYSLSLHAAWLSCRNGEWKLLVGSENIARSEEDFVRSDGRAGDTEMLADEDEAPASAGEAEAADNPATGPKRARDRDARERESGNKNDRGDADNALEKSDRDTATLERDGDTATAAGGAQRDDPGFDESRAIVRAPDRPYSYAEIKDQGEIARHLRGIVGAPGEKEEGAAGLAAFLERAGVLVFSSGDRSERRVWRTRDACTVEVEEDELLGRKTARISLAVPLADIVPGFERLDRLAAELGCERLEKS